MSALRREGGDLFIDTIAGPIKVTTDPTLRPNEIRMEQPTPCCAVSEAGYACKCHELTNGTRTFAPVTVSAEAMAAAQRSIYHVQRLHETNEARLRTLLMQPSVFLEPLEPALEGSPACGRCRRPLVRESMVSGSNRCRACHDMEKAANARDAALLAEHQRRNVDPLDVEYNGVKLRKLLELDWRNRREMNETYSVMDPAQRAAVSAYWSGRLRAKVAASAAADKARETSVVVDLEEP